MKLKYLVAGDVPELVDRDVLVEVGTKDDALAVAGGLQDPNLENNKKKQNL